VTTIGQRVEGTSACPSPHIPSRSPQSDDELIDAIEKTHVELYGNPCPRSHAARVLAAICGKAAGRIGSVKYIHIAMANDSRGDYRYRPGPRPWRNGRFVEEP
jgi:hypothetical protein